MHLLKLVRNQLLDTGLVVNKEHLKPCTFVELLNYHKSDTKRPVKLNLTDEHFSENGMHKEINVHGIRISFF